MLQNKGTRHPLKYCETDLVQTTCISTIYQEKKRRKSKTSDQGYPYTTRCRFKRVEGGRWRVEGGGWRVEGGESNVGGRDADTNTEG